MNVYVVDCSVAVKWFFPEPQWKAAGKVRESMDRMHVPALFQLEFGSAVLKKIRRDEITLEDGLQAVQDVRLLPIQKHDDEALFPLAFEVAVLTNASIYDCTYLALAAELDGIVVTADHRFVRSIAQTEYAGYVLSIEDFSAG